MLEEEEEEERERERSGEERRKGSPTQKNKIRLYGVEWSGVEVERRVCRSKHELRLFFFSIFSPFFLELGISFFFFVKSEREGGYYFLFF